MEQTDEVIKEFDEGLWCSLLHEVIVGKKCMTFVFKNGVEIKE